MDYTISYLLGQFRETYRIPHDQASPSQTHSCPGASGSRQIGHVVIFDQSQGAATVSPFFRSKPMPNTIGTYHIQPMSKHGVCFGYFVSGPLLNVRWYTVHFRGSFSGSP